MNVEVNPLNMNGICVGCLSSDRKLKILSNEETKLFVQEFLDSFDMVKESVLLCWECVAIVQKTVRFKKQVKYAKSYLMTCLPNTPAPTLSKLKITETQILDVKMSSHKKTRKSKMKITQSNTESQSISMVTCDLIYKDDLKKDSDQNDSNTDSKINKENVSMQEVVKIDSDVRETKNEDSTVRKYEYYPFPDVLVKTEDSSSLDMDVEGYYMDDNAEYGDTGNVTIAKVDIKEVNGKLKSTKRKQDATYSDSDDEPLVKKKEEKKCRKRKKEKDSSGPKPSRREKPAGVVASARVARKLQELNVAADQLEMVLLSWQEVEEERQRSLASETFTRHAYRCYDCALGFNYRVKLDNHMKKHQPSAGSLVCEVCKIHCKNAHALSAHRRRHRVRWRCVACGGAWSRAAVAADHLARLHAAAPPAHLCTVCGHTDTSLGRLRNHMKNHSERQKCELCGKTFRNRDSLRTHLFIHKGEKEYQCPQCDKKFLFKRALHVHLITHDAPALLYCHECDMNFKNRMSYGQHMRYSLKHIDPAKLKHACTLCDKKFLKAARLEEHNLAVHLKATPFHCAVQGCNFASSSRPVLRSHVRMVHRDGRAARNYVCHTCGKAYKNKKTLEGHLRSHSGERPFHCALCPATFGYEAALYNHNKVVHLKEKAGGRVCPPPGLPARAPDPPQPPATTTWRGTAYDM
ncbi:zinc finger protein 62 isoform X2 [Manduca sexta]|uniref:C2H2-type domain-containing protein n=1 Tax=Manduca sexta TaxID=7130 RepID=A0A922D013_MANSE|nr:zinc finger protein 62 isoform X2 [Manduca sexta]KAG6464959.1 hypothetical protein O3G_MSEX014835 [Manduca sexta]KAG6464960.1 hypothetical protein O3G_MSEX014835 [Manduca sexta]